MARRMYSIGAYAKTETGANKLFRMSMTSEYVSNELRRRLETTSVPRPLLNSI